MSKKVNTTLHRSVRVYEHSRLRRPGFRSMRAFPDIWEKWIPVTNNLRNHGYRIVGLGSEEGAMVVHFFVGDAA